MVESFKFPVTTTDLTGLLLEQAIEIKSSLDALIVLHCEVLAPLAQKSPADLAHRYEELRKEFLLEHAFKLQDRNPPSGDTSKEPSSTNT